MPGLRKGRRKPHRSTVSALESATACCPCNKQRNRVFTLQAGGLTELLRNVRERSVCVRSDRANGGQAHDHDQRQHNGVFDRGGTVFRDEETLYLQSKILHSILRFSGRLLRVKTLLGAGAVVKVAPDNWSSGRQSTRPP